MFATLSTFPETLPAGNSATVCINLKWSTKDMEKVTDMYNDMSALPKCSNGSPGIEVHIWHEDSSPMDEFACALNKGTSKNLGYKNQCFKHEILKEVCIYVNGEYNQLTDSFKWTYLGGCYEGGKHELMENALPETTYHFDKIPIKVYGVDSSM
jgi:hypothetical protein